MHTRVALLIVVAPMVSALAQSPAKPINLKVLPDTLSRDAVINIMGGFTRALGVQCTYCHVAKNGTRSTDDEFPIDSLEGKRVARAMLQMVQDINAKHLRGVFGVSRDFTSVTCVTCHRGVINPRSLESEMQAAYQRGGVDSAMAHYRILRARYYGRAAYDFSDVAVVTLAGRVANTPANRSDALRLMQFNLEFNGNSWFTYQQMAELQATMGDTVAAIASVQKGLAINPERGSLKDLLARLQRP